MAELKRVRIGDSVLASVSFRVGDRVLASVSFRGCARIEEGYIQRIKYDKPGYDVKFPCWSRILFVPMQDIVKHYGQETVGYSELRVGEWVDAIVRYGEKSDHRIGGFVLWVDNNRLACHVDFPKNGGPCYVCIEDITKRYNKSYNKSETKVNVDNNIDMELWHQAGKASTTTGAFNKHNEVLIERYAKKFCSELIECYAKKFYGNNTLKFIEYMDKDELEKKPEMRWP